MFVASMEIIPYKRIGNIHLQMSMDDLRKLFDGKFSTQKGKFTPVTVDYFLNSSIQVEYDELNCVAFIGVTKPHATIFNGTNLMDLTFKEIRTLLSEIDANIYQDGCTITCLDQGLSFYASTVDDENFPEEIGIFRHGHFDGYLNDYEKL